MAKRGLGKGLDALIPVETNAPAEGAQSIPIAQILPNPSQPRNDMDDEKLEELANSIREHGIIQPLILTKEPNQDFYVLIAGERRLRAAKLVGLEAVPAIVRQASDQERLELALIENIQRENLTALESAEAYQKLNDEFGLSHDQIADRVGKSRVAVTNTIRLLKLPEAAESHQLRRDQRRPRPRAAQPVVRQSPTGRAANHPQPRTERAPDRELVRKFGGEKPAAPTGKPPKDPQVREIESKLRTILGTKVTLNHGKKGGTLVIHYYSDEELDSLIRRFNEE
jgi:ParB family chromosome partitioning protein